MYNIIDKIRTTILVKKVYKNNIYFIVLHEIHMYSRQITDIL